MSTGMTTEQKRLILAVVSVLNTTTAITAEDVHRLLPDTVGEDIEHMLAILRLPAVGYRRGHHPERVLARITDLLHGIEPEDPDGPEQFTDDRY
ncbi:hypothetical protein AB0M22_09030 [Nocardia sp. NPDC051756]|uniref:hypothetical protein n=1 Tax=Nocardia sp. NPDC051756 TaxID=3154751 RepID=UPI00341AF968